MKKDSSLSPTVDRMDPNEGYVADNIVLCTNWSNSFKAEVFESQTSRFRTTPKILENFAKALSNSKYKEKGCNLMDRVGSHYSQVFNTQTMIDLAAEKANILKNCL